VQTLLEKVKEGQINQLDALDIALSLCCYIEDCDQCAHLDPREIGLDEENNVQILRQGQAVDCFYAAPDVILDGAEASRESMRFGVGCLMFFMLNGRSYCDMYNLDPVDLACDQPGDSMLDPAVYSGVGSDVICALTSWDPTRRSEGLVKLLQIVETVPATAELEYVCDGRVVLREQREVREDISDFRSGETFVGEDSVVYKVAPGTTVRFRPGIHAVKVPVLSAAAGVSHEGIGQDEVVSGGTPPAANVAATWLVVDFQNAGQTVGLRILPMDGQTRGRAVPISLLDKTRYNFCALNQDAAGNPLDKKDLFYLDVPQDLNAKRAFLNIRYHVSPRGFSVCLCNQAGQPISNSKHFKMN